MRVRYLLPMPQTKEGLMIKYYILSKIHYCRSMYLNGKKINWSINLSDMMYDLKISFPATEKGKLAKEKRLMRYIEDYLKALLPSFGIAAGASLFIFLYKCHHIKWQSYYSILTNTYITICKFVCIFDIFFFFYN